MLLKGFISWQTLTTHIDISGCFLTKSIIVHRRNEQSAIVNSVLKILSFLHPLFHVQWTYRFYDSSSPTFSSRVGAKSLDGFSVVDRSSFEEFSRVVAKLCEAKFDSGNQPQKPRIKELGNALKISLSAIRSTSFVAEQVLIFRNVATNRLTGSCVKSLNMCTRAHIQTWCIYNVG